MSNEKGQLIVISAPSGAGKTSIIKNVIKKLNNENKEAKIKSEFTPMSNDTPNIQIENYEKAINKPSRRKRGFEKREAELSTLGSKDEANKVKEI